MSKNEEEEKKDLSGLWLLGHDQDTQWASEMLAMCLLFDLGVQSIQIHFICTFVSCVLFRMCVVVGNKKKCTKLKMILCSINRTDQ